MTPHQPEPPHPGCPFDPEEWTTKFKEYEAVMEKRAAYNRTMVATIVTIGVLVVSTIIGLYTTSVQNRIGAIEMYGSAPMRERMSRNESEVESLKRDMDELKSGQREILTILRDMPRSVTR